MMRLRAALQRLSLAGLIAALPTLIGHAHADETRAMRAPEPSAGSPGTHPSRIAPALRPLRQALRPLIEDAQRRHRIPGISLAVVRGDEVLWTEGIGQADPARGLPATPSTRYRAGSLAKPITALLVLGLEASGQLDIDQPLSAALPGFRLRPRFDRTTRPITVRQLLSHHSGLPSDLYQGLWSNEPFTRVRDRLRDEFAAFPPRLVFNYSNLGYSLLGHLVQEINGIPFETVARARIFEPLQMNGTAFASDLLSDGADTLAQAHRNGRRFKPLPIRDVPAHGLITTADDLARLSIAFLCAGEFEGRQMLQPGPLESMFETQNDEIALDLDIAAGLGLFLEDGSIPGATRVARHSGNSLGYTAEWILLPEQGLGVAVLANAGHAGHVVKRLAEVILEKSIDLDPEPIPADLFIAAAQQRRLPPPAEPETNKRLTGHYATDLGLIALNPERDQLCSCMTGETIDLIPYPHGWLGTAPNVADARRASGSQPGTAMTRLRAMQLQTRTLGGREVIVAKTRRGPLVLGEKAPPPVFSDAWRNRLGAWRVLNADPGFPVEDMVLKLTDGRLCLSYRMPSLSPDRIQLPLRAVDDHRGIVLGLGRQRGDTVEIIDENGHERLRWSGYLAEPAKPNLTSAQSIE
jgi:CubicO group peptidase (beta-lactamase class C family)